MDALCYVVLFLFVSGNGNTSGLTCTPKETNRNSYENSVYVENTYANFSYRPTSRMNETSQDSDFRIEVKLHETGTLRTACICLWISKNDPVCKILWNDSNCDVDTSEMRFSLLVKRTYTNVTWVCFQQDYAPVVLKQKMLKVIYPPKITALHVNGQDGNGTHVVEQNQKVNISCFFTNGSPLVSIRILDKTGHTLSSTTHGQGPLSLSLGVFHCQDVWPVIRCEALGSEINRSVAIVVRCPPQLSYMTAQVANLKRIQYEGLTFAMKSHTGDVRKCLLTQVQSHSSSREVKCDVRGHPPKLTLILRVFNESWIGEGIWTLQIMNELGASSITFHLTNSTGSRGGNAQNETTNGNEGERTSKKSDSSTSSPGQAAGNGSKSGGSTPRSSSSGSDKPSTNPNYTSTALQEVEIHAYMDLHTRDPTYASTTSSKDPHTYMELKTLRAQSDPQQPGGERNGNDGYETPQMPGRGNQSSDGYETPQPPREGRRRSALYANQGISGEAIQEEVDYYNEA